MTTPDRQTRSRRRALGIVYTPAAIARPMVERALAPLLAGATADDARALRVCDPAMGDGAFLREVIDVLAATIAGDRGERALAVARREVATSCIYGIDVDPIAVEAARAQLAAHVGVEPAQLAHALRVGDALAGFAWRDELAEVWRTRGGFDAIVGNPPYVRQERVVDKGALHAYATYDGVADLYVYFVELAHRLARAGGRYCLIVPNKWMSAAYGRALREYLAAQRSVEGVVDFGRAPRMFAGADAFPCIVWGTVGGAARPNLADLADIAALDAHDDIPGGLAAVAPDAICAPTASVPRARWRGEPWHIDRDDDAALIAHLERTLPALGDVLASKPARGVVTGCNAAFVLDRPARDRLLAREPAAAALVRPWLKGRDVRAWRAAEVERWILLVARGASLAELPQVAAHLARFRARLEPRPAGRRGDWAGRKAGAYRWYELQDPVGPLVASRAPRLLFQDIQSAAYCCIDDGESVPDTTLWMLPTADPVLLAILNSPLYWWYARRRFPPALGGAVRPKLDYLRRFPVADPPPALRARLASLVAQRLATREAEPTQLDRAIATAVFDAYGIEHADRTRLDMTAGRATDHVVEHSPLWA